MIKEKADTSPDKGHFGKLSSWEQTLKMYQIPVRYVTVDTYVKGVDGGGCGGNSDLS